MEVSSPPEADASHSPPARLARWSICPSSRPTAPKTCKSAEAGAGQPQIGLVARPASRSYEGRRRRPSAAGASPVFATCVHLVRRCPARFNWSIEHAEALDASRFRRSCKRVRPPPGTCGGLPVIERSGHHAAVAPVGVEEPRSFGLAMADADQPSPSHRPLPLDVAGLPMGEAVRQAARPDVGRFVGLFCQPTSGFWRFVAVPSRATRSAESPVNKGNPRKRRDAGGGTRTPDTRIMIPLL